MPYIDKSKSREALRRWRARKKAGIRLTFDPRVCVSCKNVFQPLSEKHRFCSKKCSEHPIARKYGIILSELGDSCVLCGSKENLTINHKVPQCVKKDDSLDNLELMCSSCNSKSFQKLIIKALRFYFANI